VLAIQDAIQTGDLPTASRLLAAALRQHPKDGGLFNLRGIVHARRNELPKAHQDFATAVHLAPALTPAWQNLARACTLEAEHDPSSLSCTLDSWDHLVRLKADFSDSDLDNLRRLAIAYEQLQRPSDARQILERVALLEPNNTAHLLELARLADVMKDREGALGYLAHARDLAPNSAQIHFLFAMIAIEMSLPVEARNSLQRALALDPENPGYNYAMGSVVLTTRDAATAASYFQKFVKAKPTEPRGHFALGIAYFASGDYARAKEEMHAVESDPKTAGGAEYFLGRIARLEDDLDDAARRLHKSIELMPSFSESHTELARVFLDQGNLEESRAELDRALRLDPASFQGNAQLLVLYKRTHDPRAKKQAELLKKLDEDRSKRAELMLRTIDVRP
jgi:tetratricopeptide (TPR) repeat protein